MDRTGVKRKRPPTFQHLPFNRAKKLKQTWVETVKIKSKWKAQKRKEGVVTGPMDESSEAGTTEEANDADAILASEGDEQNSDDVNEPAKESDTGPSSRPISSHAKSYPSRRQKQQAQLPQHTGRSNDNSGPSGSKPMQTTSLRDLTREAYSKSSLHTYKSDPLNRRGGPGSRGKDRRRGGGRGQPNMKLRMDAMLEKIKRDLT